MQKSYRNAIVQLYSMDIRHIKPDNYMTDEQQTNTSLQQQVDEVIRSFVPTGDGSWKLPDNIDVSEDVKYAATLEKRRRDTESALGKANHKLNIEAAVRQQLQEDMVIPLDLTEEQKKFSRPNETR